MAADRSLLVVDPSTNSAEIEGAQVVVGDWPGRVRVARPALEPGSGPGPGDSHDVAAVVVMGSSASVHDDLPWLLDLGEWLAPIVARRTTVPLLGICFGHQLVAHLAGGSVGFLREDRGKLRGLDRTRFEACRLHPGGEMPVVVSHQEVVTELPNGFRVVARRESCPVDAFEHEERPVFGVQFHPEAGEEFARHIGIDGSGLTPEIVAPAREVLASFRALALARV